MVQRHKKPVIRKKAKPSATRRFLSKKTIGLLSIVVLLLIVGGIYYGNRILHAEFPLPKDNKVYFGVQFDDTDKALETYSNKLGSTPALVGHFSTFPLSVKDTNTITDEVKQLAARHTSLMLTLEPDAGLSSVTDQSLTALSKDLTRWNNAGVPILVRFGHEMNGSWYAWGQKPIEYIATFQRVATAVHKAPRSSTLWSPNEASGYPYADGNYAVKKGTADFNQLDTNHDGILDVYDNPYAPYYPGDTAVDWVGLTVYHFGTLYPWGENEIPSPRKLADKITGNYNYAGDDETAVPNFYQEFAVTHNKPFAISETGALYNASNQSGATELQIKSAWWDQLFSDSFLNEFPKLKLAVWFEVRKPEQDLNNATVDWRALANPTTTTAFKSAINSRYQMAPLQ